MSSIHSASIAEIHDMPMRVITRPFMPEIDEAKLQSLMDVIQVRI